MDVLNWLERWYEGQCDQEWEHSFGVTIESLDNPGWQPAIDLEGTDCDSRTLRQIDHMGEHETDWWSCWTKDNVFHGAGGPLHLRSLLETFRNSAIKAH